jgi:hypothetical protein
MVAGQATKLWGTMTATGWAVGFGNGNREILFVGMS